jgi:hypothetical protein
MYSGHEVGETVCMVILFVLPAAVHSVTASDEEDDTNLVVRLRF